MPFTSKRKKNLQPGKYPEILQFAGRLHSRLTVLPAYLASISADAKR